MDNKELQKKVARLESRLYQVESERSHLNTLLIDCGFPQGIQSLKATIEDLMAEADDLYGQHPSEEI